MRDFIFEFIAIWPEIMGSKQLTVSSSTRGNMVFGSGVYQMVPSIQILSFFRHLGPTQQSEKQRATETVAPQKRMSNCA